jgi:hypothetical protein
MPCLPHAFSATYGAGRAAPRSRSASGQSSAAVRGAIAATPAGRSESLLSSPSGTAHRAGHAEQWPTAWALSCDIFGGPPPRQRQSAQSTAAARAPQICRMQVSANRPSRSTRTAIETLPTESRLTTRAAGYRGLRLTSLTRPLNAMLDRFPDLRLSRSYAWEPVEAVQLRRPKMLVVDLGAARVVSTGEDRARRPGDSLRTDLD